VGGYKDRRYLNYFLLFFTYHIRLMLPKVQEVSWIILIEEQYGAGLSEYQSGCYWSRNFSIAAEGICNVCCCDIILLRERLCQDIVGWWPL
jgi:hypothetical protein